MNLFYSHASRQKPLVREISKALGSRFGAWVDEEAIKLGDGLAVRISESIENEVDIFVLVLCRDAAKSDWVKKEVAWARERSAATGDNFIFVIAVDEEVLDDPHWSFAKARKYLKLSSFEFQDVHGLAEKLREQIISWLIDKHKAAKQSRARPVLHGAEVNTFASWLQTGALSDLIEELDETIVGRSLNDIFVCPPLFPVGDATLPPEERLKGRRSKIALESIINSEENWLIFVPPEYGQTSLCRQIAYQAMANAKTAKYPRLPTIVDAARWQSAKPHEADFIRMLRRGSPDNLPKKRQILLAEGSQLIIVENVDISNPNLVSFLERFTQKYPLCRYIFTTRAATIGPPPANVVVSLGVIVKTVHAGAFEREHVRRFISRWGVPSQWDIEQTADTAIERFSQLNVPISPINLTLYMHVLEQANDFSPINLSVLLEMFIEAVLAKSDIRMVFRSEFDFTNKVDYLAHIASTMARRDEFRLPEHEFLAISEAYFEHLEVTQNAKEILEYFVAAQLLSRSDGVVHFKYTVFFSFFLAKAMAASADVRDFILSEDNCTRYLTELDIYFGCVRKDLVGLERLAAFHADADRVLDECLDLSNFSVDYSFVETLSLRTDPSTKAVFAAVARKIANGNPEDNERDDALANPMDEKIGLIQEMRRPKFRNAVARWIMTLRAYSVALKNLELISGVDKRRHLRALLLSWAKATAAGIVIVQGLAQDGHVTIGNTTIYVEDDVKKLMKGKIMRWFYLMVPHAISDYMRRDLGSPKLARMLADGAIVDNALLPEFLQKVLGSDLRVPGYLDGIQQVAGRLDDSPYLREALLWHLWRVFCRRNLKDREEKQFATVVTDLYLDINGITGAKRGEERAKILQKAKRDKLISNQRSN